MQNCWPGRLWWWWPPFQLLFIHAAALSAQAALKMVALGPTARASDQRKSAAFWVKSGNGIRAAPRTIWVCFTTLSLSFSLSLFLSTDRANKCGCCCRRRWWWFQIRRRPAVDDRDRVLTAVQNKFRTLEAKRNYHLAESIIGLTPAVACCYCSRSLILHATCYIRAYYFIGELEMKRKKGHAEIVKQVNMHAGSLLKFPMEVYVVFEWTDSFGIGGWLQLV